MWRGNSPEQIEFEVDVKDKDMSYCSIRESRLRDRLVNCCAISVSEIKCFLLSIVELQLTSSGSALKCVKLFCAIESFGCSNSRVAVFIFHFQQQMVCLM